MSYNNNNLFTVAMTGLYGLSDGGGWSNMKVTFSLMANNCQTINDIICIIH